MIVYLHLPSNTLLSSIISSDGWWRKWDKYPGDKARQIKINRVNPSPNHPTMTRPRNHESSETEARLQQALAAIRSKACKTVREAACKFNVPPSTLGHRLNGRASKNLAHEQDQNLTHAEEAELERWITKLTRIDYPPRHQLLREMAEEIRKHMEIDKTIRTGIMRIIKAEWLSAYINARTTAFSLWNIFAGWDGQQLVYFLSTRPKSVFLS